MVSISIIITILLAAVTSIVTALANNNPVPDAVVPTVPKDTSIDTCQELSELCPGCHGRNLADPSGSYYNVVCDEIILTAGTLTLQDANTPKKCMEACTSHLGCGSVIVRPNGTCALAVDPKVGMSKIPGVANLRLTTPEHPDPTRPSAYISNAVSSSAAEMARMLDLVDHLPSSVSIQALSTAPISLRSNPSNTSPQQCSLILENLCPACNGVEVKDDSGRTYSVHCNSHIDSTGYYAIQRWLTPQGCLLECDQFDWCNGANFYPPGNCALAKVNPVLVDNQPGSMAFLPATRLVRKQTSTVLRQSSRAAATAATSTSLITVFPSPIRSPESSRNASRVSNASIYSGGSSHPPSSTTTIPSSTWSVVSINTGGSEHNYLSSTNAASCLDESPGQHVET